MRDLNVLRHIKPILLFLVPQIATSIYTILDKSMIGIITGIDTEIAYYEQAQKIIKMALAIPVSFGTVMLPRMANIYGKNKKNSIKTHILFSMKFVCMLTFPLCFGVIGIAKDFVPWFFGNGFGKVYENLLVMAPIIVLVGISNVLGVQYLLPTNMQKYYTVSVVIGTVLNFAFNSFLIPLFLSLGAAFGSIIAEGSVAITQIIILKDEFSLKQIIANVYKYLIGAIIMLGIISLYSHYIGDGRPFHTFAEICIGITIYGVYLILIKDDIVIKNMGKQLKD